MLARMVHEGTRPIRAGGAGAGAVAAARWNTADGAFAPHSRLA